MIQVCEAFPEITLESTESGATPGVDAIMVTLDLERCAVSISSITSTNTGVGSGVFGAPQALIWRGDAGLVNVPIALTYPHTQGYVSEAFPTNDDGTATIQRRFSTVSGRMKGARDFGLVLTEAYFERNFNTSTLNTFYIRSSCKAGRPLLLVTWHNDRCDGTQSVSGGFNRANTTSRFHASSIGNWALSGDSRHTIEVSLKGSYIRDIRRCTYSPRSFVEIRALGFLSLGFSRTGSTRLVST